jgi:transcriptional regulator with XRE-family HTH domain
MLRIIVSDFGTWLKTHRLRTGLSLRQLENRIDKICTFAYLAQLEKGVPGKKGEPARPSAELLEALAKVFSVPIDEARQAAGYASDNPDDMHDLEGVRIAFLPGQKFTDADKDEISKNDPAPARGYESGEGKMIIWIEVHER